MKINALFCITLGYIPESRIIKMNFKFSTHFFYSYKRSTQRLQLEDVRPKTLLAPATLGCDYTQMLFHPQYVEL